MRNCAIIHPLHLELETAQPNIMNTWEAWDIQYVPRVLGKFQQYDSADPDVIDDHLSVIGSAGFDFLLEDQTNNINVDDGYIKARALAVCAKIASRRSSGNLATPRYAIAVGAIQYNHRPETIDDEAKIVLGEFVNSPTCGGPANYFKINNKPLLVVYSSLTDRRMWEAWHKAKCVLTTTNLCASDNFTLRWIQGHVLPPSKKSSCWGGPYEDQPDPASWGEYYGWGMPDGALENDEAMVVMPGWNNRRYPHAAFVSRKCKEAGGSAGSFYKEWGWERVHRLKPRLVIVNSFNEYSEETAVAPADSSAVNTPSEQWLDDAGNLAPDLYWNMTIQNNHRRKQ